MPKFLIILICGILAVIPCVGKACGLPGQVRSGAVSPRGPSDIHMESERVTIRLGRSKFTVDAEFHLFNPGETTAERVRFPKEGLAEDSDLICFTAWAEGKKVDLTVEYDAGIIKGLFERIASNLIHRYPALGLTGLGQCNTDRWLVGNVIFPARKTTTLRARYESTYDGQSATYILGTASNWKDDVEKSIFVIDATEVGGTNNIAVHFLRNAPGPELLGDNLLKLELRHCKPPPESGLSIHVRR
ncbi:MAG: hypothetical protein WBG50_18280 [Desulfomonilaceae bacterium]